VISFQRSLRRRRRRRLSPPPPPLAAAAASRRRRRQLFSIEVKGAFEVAHVFKHSDGCLEMRCKASDVLSQPSSSYLALETRIMTRKHALLRSYRGTDRKLDR